MDVMLGFLGTYITAAELIGKTPTLTISKVTLEKVESLKMTEDDAGGKMKDRIVIYFAEGKSGRGWLLNRTNAESLKAMWGRETEQWLGKRVTLFTQQVRVGPKMEPGIRVKGSPDLKEPLKFEMKLPRKKPILTTLVPTGKVDQKPERKIAHGPTLDDAIALLDKGDRETALSLREGLSEEDQVRFDAEYNTGESTV